MNIVQKRNFKLHQNILDTCRYQKAKRSRSSKINEIHFIKNGASYQSLL